MTSEKRLYNRKQLAKALGIHPRTVLNYRKKGLPYIKIGDRSTRYDFDEVVEWFKKAQDPVFDIPYLSASPSVEIPEEK